MMIYSRAALSALVTLALSACVTTAPTDNQSNAVLKEKVDTGHVVGGVVVTDSDLVTQIQTPPNLSNETILYGAMTKYELMIFVEAVTNTQMQGTLEADTPMTVFAPNNLAFEYANIDPQMNMKTLIEGHMVAGHLDIASLKEAVKTNSGPVRLKTAAGTELTVYIMGDKIKVAGPYGRLATLTASEMTHSNGILHQINDVFKPPF